MKHTKRASPATAASTPSGASLAAISAPLVVSEIEAAQMLRLSPRTLQRLRLDGGGPRFVMLTSTGSRIGYPVAELHRWLAARTVASTSATSATASPAR